MKEEEEIVVENKKDENEAKGNKNIEPETKA